MKKICALMGALLMLLALSACGLKTENENASAPAATQVPAAEETAAPTRVTEPPLEEVPFEEVTVVDDENCTVKITGMVFNNERQEVDFDVFLENKSPDKTYLFDAQTASINGLQVNMNIAEEMPPEGVKIYNMNDAELSAGVKTNLRLAVYKYGPNYTPKDIWNCTDIRLTFRVYADNDWRATVASGSARIYPYGEENVTKYTRQPKNTDKILMDNDVLTVIATGYEDTRSEEYGGYCVNLFVTNKSDETITLWSDRISVNGLELPFSDYKTVVGAGECSYDYVNLWNDELANLEISDVESVEVEFDVYPGGDAEWDWNTEKLVSETIVWNP